MLPVMGSHLAERTVAREGQARMSHEGSTVAEGVAPVIELVDLGELKFDNSFVRELPADPMLDNVPRQVRGACYTLVDPTPVRSPTLLAWSDSVGTMLGLKPPRSSTGPVAEVLGGTR